MSNTATHPTTTAFSVTGMTCGCCESDVQQTVATVPGVQSARVEPQSGRALVDFDPSVTTASAIGAAMSAAGYPAAAVRDGSSEPRPPACGCGCR